MLLLPSVTVATRARTKPFGCKVHNTAHWLWFPEIYWKFSIREHLHSEGGCLEGAQFSGIRDRAGNTQEKQEFGIKCAPSGAGPGSPRAPQALAVPDPGTGFSHKQAVSICSHLLNRREERCKRNHGKGWHFSRHDINNILISSSLNSQAAYVDKCPVPIRHLCSQPENKKEKKRGEPRPGPNLLSLLLSRTSTIWACTGHSPKSGLSCAGRAAEPPPLPDMTIPNPSELIIELVLPQWWQDWVPSLQKSWN